MTFSPVTIESLDALSAAAARDSASAYALGNAFCGTVFGQDGVPQPCLDDAEQKQAEIERVRLLVRCVLARDFVQAHMWFERALALETSAARRTELAFDIALRCVRAAREVPISDWLERFDAGAEAPGAAKPLEWNVWTLYAAALLDRHIQISGVAHGRTLTAALLQTGLLVALGAPDPSYCDEHFAGEWAGRLSREYHDRLDSCATYAATGRDLFGSIAAGLYANPAHARWLLCRANQDLYGALMVYVLNDGEGVEPIGAAVPAEVRAELTDALHEFISAQVLAEDGALQADTVQRQPHLVTLWVLLAVTEMFWSDSPRDYDLDVLRGYLDAVRERDVIAAATRYQLTAELDGPAVALSGVFERSLGHFAGRLVAEELSDYEPFFVAQLVGKAEADVQRARDAEGRLAAETARREMQERLIAGAAHQFRGTIAALVANASRKNEQRTTLAETRSLNSLLNLFTLVSGDPARMRAALAADRMGNADIGMVAANALRHAVVSLLAERRRASIDRFLLRYVRENGLVPTDVTEEEWHYEDHYREVANRLASAWEDDLVGPMAGADLAAMGSWMQHHLVPFTAMRVDVTRRFSSDGTIQALLLTLLTELLANAIQYYDRRSTVPIELAIEDDGTTITLSCSNPASVYSRGQRVAGGCGRGLDYLEMIADKLGGQLLRPDDSNCPCATFRFPIPDSP